VLYTEAWRWHNPVCERRKPPRSNAQLLPTELDFYDWEREKTLMDMHQSFERILASKQVIGDLFYEALFTRHPEIRPFFEGIDLRRQAVLLTMELSVIDAFHRFRNGPARLYLQYLGTKHHHRGIPLELYSPFRDTMLEVLQRFLEGDWTEELATEWKTAIDDASAVMFEGYSKHFTV
jgi:hemoglobin-like flavoprotein